uniref:Vacuolar protein 8 n=1 Tax=Hanusia phi TaxID=3032 RepID=A0A7S0I038_9CRYP|mmetsp:Transcript_722/g.1544  ORF Transcript_722/g.1544 Transcript_722/m.1544 type:complete len:391 (+) Transcript_722:70-1242(+)
MERFLDANIAQLQSDNIRDVVLAVETLFEHAHTSNHFSALRKDQFRVRGGIPLLCNLLKSTSWYVRIYSCSALGELAFGNEENALAIVETEGALENLVELLSTGHNRMKEDAALVLNNCAAFCEEVCPKIVSCEGLLQALKASMVSGPRRVRSVAVGAINCISRCEAARQSLVEGGFVDVLYELQEACDDANTMQNARAILAILNLVGSVDEGRLPEGSFDTILDCIVKMFKSSLEGRVWSGIHFAPYSILCPLRSLVNSKRAAGLLLDKGILKLLSEYLSTWQKDQSPYFHQDRSIVYALQAVMELSRNADSQGHVKESRIVLSLLTVCEQGRGEPERCKMEAEQAIENFRSFHLALWMSQHPRLGAVSNLSLLDDFLLGLISRLSFGV